MVNLTIDQIRALMDKRSNIRNMCVIAHTNHGKSTLTDSLVCRAGINTNEKERGGITIKSTAIPMYYETDQEALVDIKEKTESRDFLINLIDSSGHPDSSSEATAALRVTDGAILVVDVIEGVCVQTEMVLRQALTERIRPALVINKIDRALLELQLTKEALYSSFLRVIESVNVVITTYHDDALGNCQVYPDKGNVAFASGLHGWAFTLRQFAIRYAKKFNVDKDKMMERLWGDNFFNPATKTWTTKSTAEDGTQLERAFCMFVLDPIFRIFYSVLNYEVDTYRNLFLKLNVPMLEEDYEKKGKDLLRIFMNKFLPAAEALLEMVVIQLPSPATAQAYRCETFYEGPNDDECAIAIKSCDPSGPLMLYVSKMVPTSDKGRFFAFGRVFSGTVKAGLKVRIQGPDYEPGTKKDLFVKTIQGTVLMMGPSAEAIEDCPAGNIIGLVGIDQFLVRSGTITTSETAHNFLTLSSKQLAVSPIVQVAVDVIKPNDLPKLIEGLRWLTKTDPSVSCIASDTGEHFVTGADVLHLERCLKNLEQDYVPIRTSDPVVSYRETIRSKSSQVAVSKSANTHNHISMSAQPLNEEVCKDIEVGRIDPKDEFTVRARYLNELHNWDLDDARKIWEFGPDGVGPNILIDTTTEAVQYLNEIKDAICLAFRNASREGALANEPMRGCRFNLVDVTLHADAIYRGQGQLMPTARSCIYAAELLSDPAIMEPVYQVEIYCPQNGLDGVYSVLNRRRGHVFFEEQLPGSPIFKIKAYLPVNESFGFAADLRMATQGQAFPQSVLDHWQLMPGSPLDATSKVNAIVKAVRKRKGLSEEIPTLDLFLNRL